MWFANTNVLGLSEHGFFLTLVFRRTLLLIFSWCLQPKTSLACYIHSISQSTLVRTQHPVFANALNWHLMPCVWLLTAFWHFLSPCFLLRPLVIVSWVAVWHRFWLAISTSHLSQHPYLASNPPFCCLLEISPSTNYQSWIHSPRG